MVKAPELMQSPGPLRVGPRGGAMERHRRRTMEEGTMAVGSAGSRVAWRSTVWLLVLLGGASGCFWRDPLDPHGELSHRVAPSLTDAEQMAKGREAYERARGRVGRVQSGMSVAEVEAAMEAIVVAQGQEEQQGKDGPRRKFIEGFLCRYEPVPLRQRWLFGYDEGGVELVGFVLEFQRDDPESDKWIVRSVDRHPTDDCPE